MATWQAEVFAHKRTVEARALAATMMDRVVRRMELATYGRSWNKWRDVVAWGRQQDIRLSVEELEAKMAESQKAHAAMLMQKLSLIHI